MHRPDASPSLGRKRRKRLDRRRTPQRKPDRRSTLQRKADRRRAQLDIQYLQEPGLQPIIYRLQVKSHIWFCQCYHIYEVVDVDKLANLTVNI